MPNEMNIMDVSTNKNHRLPFVRFHVHRPPVTKPRAFERLEDDVWDQFLLRLDSVTSKSHEWVDLIATVVRVMLVGSTLILSLGTDMNRYLLSIVFLVCYSLTVAWKEEIKRRDFERLQNACREEEENIFKPHGFFVECHDEQKPMDGRPTGCYVYFLWTSASENPSDYVRVEVAKDGLCGWRISPSLDYYDYVPDGLASIPLTVWSEFWRDVDQLATEYISHRRRLFRIIALYFIVMATGHLWNGIVFMVISLILIPLLLYGFYCLSVTASIDMELERVCSDYTQKFHEHGVYLEYRKENDLRTWQRCLNGGTVGRFLCMYKEATLQSA